MPYAKIKFSEETDVGEMLLQISPLVEEWRCCYRASWQFDLCVDV